MKFKSIFVIFNLIILVSFSMIFFMPALLLGPQYARVFWQESWYLAVIFFFVLLALDSYFIFHWKLFSYLEQEDWAALQVYTREKLLDGKFFSNQNVNLFINSCLMLNDMMAIEELGKLIKEQAPEKALKYQAGFGIPILLRHDGKEIIEYYGQAWNTQSTVKNRIDPWLGWMYAFGLLLEKEDVKAKEVLVELLELVKKASPLELLTNYLLKNFPDEGLKKKIEDYRTKISSVYTPNAWQKHMEKSRETIQVLLLQSIIQEASQWLYKK